MIGELPLRPAARFTFVVGKGGVGKSTTAAALALSFADAGRRTRLFSTDPAHSLGDLFGEELRAGIPTPSRCTHVLLLEQLDARSRASAWMDERRDALSELVALGTILDQEDVGPFLELPLPGVDEFIGALRLTELVESEDEAVVVDTAPTGHTLRLLDSERLLEGWIRALEAMDTKARVVQQGLVRARIHLPAEDVLDELRTHIRRFRTAVLAEADFLVVSRDDDLVRAETNRLIAHLQARDLHVAGELRVGHEGAGERDGVPGVPVLRVPWTDGLIGCEGLRRWGRARRPPTPPAASRIREPAPLLTPETFGRELLFFAGKGGVGKSTCAAASAIALSRSRHVILLGTDPAGSIEDLFGADPPKGSVGSRLRIQQVDPEAALDKFHARYREQIDEVFERLGLASARLDREVAEALLAASPPGMDEIFALDSILDPDDASGPESPRRTRVVDAAPTGHFLRLVETPRLALDWVHAMLRLLLKYRAAVGLDRSAEELLQFAKRLRGLLGLLADPGRTGVVVVTLDAPLVVRETERLLAALEGSGLPVLAVLHNQTTSGPGVAPDRSGGSVGKSTAVLNIEAPRVVPPPAGPEALEDFFSRWELRP